MYAYGQSLRGKSLEEQEVAIGAAVGQGGDFDFQRENGKFIPDYINASNYGVGVLMNGAGFTFAETLAAGSLYGYQHSNLKFDINRIVWWFRGYDDAYHSRLPRRKI